MPVNFEEETINIPTTNTPRKNTLVDFLINHKIAKNTESAYRILLILSIVALILAFTILFRTFSSNKLAPDVPFKDLPQEIKARIPIEERIMYEQYEQ